MYFYFDPEIDPHAGGSAADHEAAYRTLTDEFVRVVTEANFIEITHDEITRAFAERARIRVRIKAPVEDFRDVRMFRRGHHSETIEIPEEEAEEVAKVFREYGLDEKTVATVTAAISSDRQRWIDRVLAAIVDRSFDNCRRRGLRTVDLGDS